MAEVFVNHMDTFAGPAKSLGALHKRILSPRALLVFLYLHQRRLAHIHAGQSAQMLVTHFVTRDHAPPPRRSRGQQHLNQNRNDAIPLLGVNCSHRLGSMVCMAIAWLLTFSIRSV